ncbi:MAG: hypothetical protein HQL65_20370 [Magnetococcales bacterium]|nr:hypothetical protein [Magnetococcales bacterium]
MTHHVLLDLDLKEVMKRVATLNMTHLVRQLLQLYQQAENHLAGPSGEKACVQGYEQECRQFLDREASRYQQGNNWLTA